MLKSIFLLIFLLFVVSESFGAQNYLRPFTSDGCSSVPDFNFINCCIDHDIAYWQGGTYEQRLEADEELYQCIKEKSGSDIAAGLFYYGVRVGGRPGTNQSYRWGYGWAYRMDYRELTSHEQYMVDKLMPTNPYDVIIGDGDDNRVKLPSQYDNYCIDEVYKYVIYNFEGEVESVDIHLDNKGRIKKIDATINKKEVFRFRYHTNQWGKCTKPVYDEVLPNYYFKVSRFNNSQ